MCLIDDKNKFIFFHNPKCGGTSVRDALEGYGQKPIDPGNGLFDNRFRLRNPVEHKFWFHERAANVRAYYGKWAKEEYYAFGLIRNPWDRMVSWWSFIGWSKEFIPRMVVKDETGKFKALNLTHADNTHLLKKEPEVSFDEFVEESYNVMINLKDQFELIRLHMDNKHFKGPLVREDRFWIVRTIFPYIANNFFTDVHNNYCVDIFKLENISKMVDEVEKRIGIRINIPHLNISSRDRDYRKYYTPKLKRMVEEIYQSDVEIGKYQF